MRTFILSLALAMASNCAVAAQTPQPKPVPSPSPFDGAKVIYQWDWVCNAPNCILGGPLIGPAGEPVPQGKTVSIWLIAMPGGGSTPTPAYFVYFPQRDTWIMTQIASNFNFTANHLSLHYAGIPNSAPVTHQK